MYVVKSGWKYLLASAVVATFLGVPNAPAALTNPVSPTESAALDAKCGAVAASVHSH